jgi:hypothetical protein
MNIIPLTEGEIRNIILSLKSKNTSGYDGIYTKILKLCCSQMRRPFPLICDKSIMMGVFPDCLHYAILKPLYKTGERYSRSNYRAISLLTAFSEVMEKTMCHRLNQHLQVSNILVTEHYSLRKCWSTECASYSIIDGIFHACNSQIHSAGIFCDLPQDCDCVNHKISITKLQYYGLNSTRTNWFTSYLLIRRQSKLKH